MNKLDPREELEKMLSEQLAKNIDREIINNLLKPIKLVNDFNSKLDELKAINRQLQIDSVIGDDSISLIKVEDTEEYKNLPDEYKQQYKGDYIHINFL
jgi:hypothetical protein